MTPSKFHESRMALGHTVSGMARALECSRKTVQRIENGKGFVSPNIAERTRALLSERAKLLARMTGEK